MAQISFSFSGGFWPSSLPCNGQRGRGQQLCLVADFSERDDADRDEQGFQEALQGRDKKPNDRASSPGQVEIAQPLVFPDIWPFAPWPKTG